MGGFLSQMTAEESKPAQQQVSQSVNYGTPQKKIELADPRSPTQHLDRTPVVVKGTRSLHIVAKINFSIVSVNLKVDFYEIIILDKRRQESD